MSNRFSTGSYGPHEEGPGVADARETLPDEETSSRMALFASGFADPGRIRLLMALSNGPLCVGDLALVLSVSQSSVSHQLRLLRSLGIVSSSRKGRHIYYALAWPGATPVLRELFDAAGHNESRQNPGSPGDNTQEDV